MQVHINPAAFAADTHVRLLHKGETATGALAAILHTARFEGGAGDVAEFFGVEGAERLLVVGLGEADKRDHHAAEKAGGAVAARLIASGARSVSVDVGGLDAEAAARLANGALLRAYRFDKYHTKTPDKKKPTLADLALVNAPEGTAAAWARHEAIARGVTLTRDLVTEPANIMYPESFVERAQALAQVGVKIEVLDVPAMEKLGMGALLGVAMGSIRPARLLIMSWDGTGGASTKPVVFVGKGVTFDTGGISIKPAQGMEDMKYDMAGAGAVTGAMMALASRKAKAHVVGICGLVENMPSDRAIRPGDVLTTMSGQTAEVINTDAEGRLVLCDAVWYAQERFKPEIVIDLATLTGAMVVALGNEFAGMFANNDGLATDLLASATASGDKLWRMPLADAYDKAIDSPIADMKNIGGREAGSATAAHFIGRFIQPGVKWAHLDIAGMAWASKDLPLIPKGATGYGVRLLDRYIADHHEG
jgi:leucyl aminopeptidase